jgi:hypothetical protein
MAELSDLAFLDATAQAELVRRKEMRAIELVEASIKHIERLLMLWRAYLQKILFAQFD